MLAGALIAGCDDKKPDQPKVDSTPKTGTVNDMKAGVDKAADQAKKAAAEAYLRISKDKATAAEILAMLNDPNIIFTTTPQNVMKYVDFMYKVGSIKVKADSWKDLFFPNIHGAPGS